MEMKSYRRILEKDISKESKESKKEAQVCYFFFFENKCRSAESSCSIYDEFFFKKKAHPNPSPKSAL